MATDLNADSQVQTVQRDLTPIITGASALRILSHEGYVQAGEGLKFLKTGLKTIEDARVRITKPINDGLKAVNDQARDAKQPLLDAEMNIKRAMLAYDNEQERIRREEQRKADEAARKERERLEGLRRAEEARAREAAEAARKAAEEARLAGQAEEAARLAHKAEAIEAKSEAKVESLMVRQETTVAPTIVAAPPKVAGISYRTVWKPEVTDKMALIKAVAAGTVPPSVLDLNMEALRGAAKQWQGDLNWPGVKAVAIREVASGRA